jgi:adenosylhomocysteine nucleosidase
VSRFGIITGMGVEAAQFTAAASALPSEDRPLIASVGGDSRKAEKTALGFATAGVQGLISFGIAGGLDSSLRSGDIVVADAIKQPDGTITATHGEWSQSVTKLIDPDRVVVRGAIVGSDFAVATVKAKAVLHARWGAVAVDMESHGVARAAETAGIPLLAVRAIADPSARSIPDAALAGIGADGQRRPIAVLVRLLRDPMQLTALIRVARDSHRALNNLSSTAPAILTCSDFS